MKKSYPTDHRAKMSLDTVTTNILKLLTCSEIVIQAMSSSSLSLLIIFSKTRRYIFVTTNRPNDIPIESQEPHAESNSDFRF